MCETVLLIPVMSQAVLLSEAYGEKVTSCFILISIITLWRAFIFLCLWPSLTPPCFSAFPCPWLSSGSWTTCSVLNLQEIFKWEETRWHISIRGYGRAVSLSSWKWCSHRKHHSDALEQGASPPVNPVRPAVAAGLKPTVAGSLPLINTCLKQIAKSCCPHQAAVPSKCDLHISYHQMFVSLHLNISPSLKCRVVLDSELVVSPF